MSIFHFFFYDALFFPKKKDRIWDIGYQFHYSEVPQMAIIFTISSIISNIMLYLCMGYYAAIILRHPSFHDHLQSAGSVIIWPLFEHFTKKHILLLVWFSSITLQETVLVQLKTGHLWKTIQTVMLPISLGCLHMMMAYTYATWNSSSSRSSKFTKEDMALRRSSPYSTKFDIQPLCSKVRRGKTHVMEPVSSDYLS